MIESEYMIRSLTNDIWSLTNRIQSNAEDINRLEQAKNNILKEQEELAVQKKLVFDPELASDSWAGKHAAEFLNIRSDIEQAYTTISNQKVESLLERITSEITRLQNLNSSLSQSVESKENHMNAIKSK